MTPRPEVARFADAVEARLLANDHKGGWPDLAPTSLIAGVVEAAAEL